MPSEDTKTLEFNQYQKSDKKPFIIHAVLQFLIEKIDGCRNNTESSAIIKMGEHIPSGFSVCIISPFKTIESKHDIYKGKDCMQKFCESLREHEMKITNFKKNEVINK